MLKFINILFQDYSITQINLKPKQGDLKIVGTIYPAFSLSCLRNVWEFLGQLSRSEFRSR